MPQLVQQIKNCIPGPEGKPKKDQTFEPIRIQAPGDVGHTLGRCLAFSFPFSETKFAGRKLEVESQPQHNHRLLEGRRKVFGVVG